MIKQKLYIKLPNGRYKEYVEPYQELDNKLYKKRNGRYVPWGMELYHNELDEGVWVITKTRSCKSFTNAKIIHENFAAIKASDIIEAPTLAELGGYEKLCAHLLENWSRVDTTCVDTIIHSVVGILMQYKEGKNET